jgi:hypothetical protein
MAVADLAGTVEQAKAQLASLVTLAVDTLQELALGAERDNVRLAAAEAILDRSGLPRGAALQVSTDSEQHRQAELAALELVQRLARNKAAEALPTPSPDVETLLVLEDESDDLPLAGGPYEGAIEAHHTE